MLEIGPLQASKSIFSKNTCKTCAYGMGGADGILVNEVGESIQICKKSVQAQISDVQKAIDVQFITTTPIEKLKKIPPKTMERMGRLDEVLFKSAGDTHFKKIDLAEGVALVTERFLQTTADKTFFYSSGRSSNEAAFILHLFARIFGTNNVNNCSYYCHQASGVGMGATLGTGTATVELQDLKKADLIFVIGANPSSNHPRFLTELMECRRRGGHVVVINPVREPGLDKFSIPSDVKSLLSFGSELASLDLQPKIGKDIEILSALAKMVIENDAHDLGFIEKNCSGFEEYLKSLDGLEINHLCSVSAVEIEKVKAVADLYCNSQNVIFTWAMGITHHQHGVENVEAIVNLALLRGMMGRKHAGLLPLRGHSNVQGVGSVGVSPKLKANILANLEKYLTLELPKSEGWDTMRCMDEAFNDNVDVAWIMGGNLYASNPNLTYAESALNKIKTKIYLTTTLNNGHVIPSEGEIIVFPVMTRDEEIQSTTQESMFNYVRLSEGGQRRLKNARSETELIANVASAVVSEKVFDFSKFIFHRNIRKAIAEVIPGFEQIARIEDEKKGFHVENRIKHEALFDTADGKAKFSLAKMPVNMVLDVDDFHLMTVRSEGQFNSIIYEEEDAWRGVKSRDVVFMNPLDMADHGLKAGDRISLKSNVGEINGLKIVAFEIAKNCLMAYYPECNIVVEGKLDPRSKTPAFKNTIVKITKSYDRTI